MTQLTALTVMNVAGRLELRADWDNDRHQAVDLKRGDPEYIIKALDEMSSLLKSEIFSRNI